VRVLGAPDILVNNAGVYPRVPFLEMRESDWDMSSTSTSRPAASRRIAAVKPP
jgi:NAD(P)-dependent dehydrogenase (short-subunit alcohol dehydrogenase family)